MNRAHDISLRFDASAIANANGDAPILYGNRPNPFSGETEVRFYLPKAQSVKMTVFNALGQAKYAHEAWFEAGMQSITLSALDLGEKGILHCVINTDAWQ